MPDSPIAKNLIVVGGGAAGFFAAITAAESHPGLAVTILERSAKLLSKVRISGGGRCNVTHACFDPSELIRFYPRGGKELRSVFSRFGPADTVEWFHARGVELKTEADGRMFPVSNSSDTIVQCLLNEANRLGIKIKTGVELSNIDTLPHGFRLDVMGGGQFECDRLILATGGSSKSEGYEWIRRLGHTIEPPAPSLFTFNIPKDPIVKLMGLSVPHAGISIVGTNIHTEGPLLITHWGLSGPAVLKASSLGARVLQEKNYQFEVIVQWISCTEEELHNVLLSQKKTNGGRLVFSTPLFELPRRLWEYLAVRSGISADERWADLSKEKTFRFAEILLHDRYSVQGKTTFKEEFVTCGGIRLSEVNFSTMESKKVKGLHFAGELLDIDGLTGGFNFQNAWSTGYLAGKGFS